ncbi:unnamed protein product, partial [Ceratitis capitata]
MNVREKFDTVIRHKYYVNRLSRLHKTLDCTSKTGCSTCNGEHHSTLHGHPKFDQEGQQSQCKLIILIHAQATDIVSLSTKLTIIPIAVIRVKHYGIGYTFSAHVNLTRKLTTIATELVKKLKLPYSHNICSLTVRSLSNNHLHVKCNSLVTSELSTRPYGCDLGGEIMKRFDQLVLADPKFITTVN